MRLILILSAALCLSACASRPDNYFGQISQRVGDAVGH